MVAAGLSKNRVVMWEYIETPWNGAEAEALYRNPIKKILNRIAPGKAHPVIVEDNDPTGYKSRKAINAKKALGFRVVSLPPYSPDLNPCDFFLWDSIEQRMARSAPKNAKESLAKYKARLRKTAMATSKHLVRKALLNMKPRVQAIYEAKGRDIDMD